MTGLDILGAFAFLGALLFVALTAVAIVWGTIRDWMAGK